MKFGLPFFHILYKSVRNHHVKLQHTFPFWEILSSCSNTNTVSVAFASHISTVLDIGIRPKHLVLWAGYRINGVDRGSRGLVKFYWSVYCVVNSKFNSLLVVTSDHNIAITCNLFLQHNLHLESDRSETPSFIMTYFYDQLSFILPLVFATATTLQISDQYFLHTILCL